MSSASEPSLESRLPPVSHATPIVFVVDDDISVRESLELLIRYEGWQSVTFASAQEFLNHPRVFAPCCLVLDVSLPDLQKRIAVDRFKIVFVVNNVMASASQKPWVKATEG
jgi:FixJ family two-component response regulator